MAGSLVFSVRSYCSQRKPPLEARGRQRELPITPGGVLLDWKRVGFQSRNATRLLTRTRFDSWRVRLIKSMCMWQQANSKTVLIQFLNLEKRWPVSPGLTSPALMLTHPQRPTADLVTRSSPQTSSCAFSMRNMTN